MFFRFPWSVASILIFDYTWKSMWTEEAADEDSQRRAEFFAQADVARGGYRLKFNVRAESARNSTKAALSPT